MRVWIASLLLATTSQAFAAAPEPAAFAAVFELSGVRLLCDQALPLLQRGLSEQQQAQVNQRFSADGLCDDLAKRLATRIDPAQLEQARLLLDSPLAHHFTDAERAVAENGATELAEYRAQLAERPARQSRVDLVHRLDVAANTTNMATLLRYESGKTQALIAVKARGERLDEQSLSDKTAEQERALRESSKQAVESFMLFAYRRIPSEQIAEYAALYEQPAVKQLLENTLQVVPELFAERRAQLP